jgi:hypothetical protein
VRVVVVSPDTDSGSTFFSVALPNCQWRENIPVGEDTLRHLCSVFECLMY